ncbi:MAG TPA: protein tyrosine phosphatase [Polyangiaceae bacterium]|nr:protein tyrosine phosphatase [Polyangiaceae bacterium]
MRGFVDLHCHFIAGIDDGARSAEEGIALLRALHSAGFDRVIATPHMRPGLFDNSRVQLTAAYEQLCAQLPNDGSIPKVDLSSEHYFDDVIFSRIMNDEALPYPGGKAVLLEFYEIDFLPMIDHRFFDLRAKKRLLPVIAHPERYRAIWKSPATLERLVDAGAAALLDAAAFAGKYGRRAKRAAEELLEMGLYHAACSDAHRPDDVLAVLEGMRVIEKRYGSEEIEFLFRDGPLALLEGQIPE